MSEQIRVVDPCDFPYTKVDNAAILDANLSIYDSHVYVTLCSFASNKTGGAYPSMKTLASRAKCSERQARSSIRVLEEQGYIRTSKQVGGVNIYTLTRNKHLAEEKEQVADTPAQCAAPSASGAAPPGTVCRRTRLNELDKDYPPTEGEAEKASRPVDPSEIPTAMRQVAEYLLLKAGRKSVSPEELPAIRALERIHTPARVNQEIVVALKRFERLGRDPASLTFGYLLDCLKHQTSGSARQAQKTRASPKADDAEKKRREKSLEWEREQQREIERRFGGDGGD